jgi:flagellar M-ring protein FliF
MDKIVEKIAAFFKGLTLGQRVTLGGSALLVAGTVWLFAHFMDAADYKVLSSGMAPADAHELAHRLVGQNIDYRLSPDGTAVLVRGEQLDRARLETASDGPLASGRLGFELFDKPNWSGSDFSEKVNYQRALEAELERTIQTMNGVDAVRVHLVLPRESLFSERERPAKAAVVLKLRGTRLTDAIASSVVNLVASSWDDLAPQNVTVVTTDGQIPASGNGHKRPAGYGGDQELETALAERIVQTLGPIVGNDHVKSSITIDYDQNSGESTQELYDPANSAVLTSQTSQETTGDLEPAGIPGTTSNTPGTPGNAATTPQTTSQTTPQTTPLTNPAAPIASTASATTSAAGAAATQGKTAATTQGIRTDTKTFAVSKTTHRVLEPAGRIRRIAAAILVDDAVETKTEGGKTQETRRKRTPEEMKQIESLAKAAVGFDMQRGDQFSLENISFVMPAVEMPTPPGKIQKIMTYAERWTNVLRYAGLLALFAVVYLLLLRPVKNQVLHILQSPGEALPAGTRAAAALPAGITGAIPDANSEGSEVSAAVALKKELVARVRTNPQAAGQVIETWMRET